MENTEKIEILEAQIMVLKDPERFFSIISKATSIEDLSRAYNVSEKQAKAMGEIPMRWIGNKNVLNRLREEQKTLSM